MNTGRLIGIGFMVAGFLVAILVGLWLVVQIQAGAADGGFSPATGILTGGVVFIPVALLVGLGIFLLVRGGQEAEVESSVHQQRQLLDLVKNQGPVKISDLALNLNINVATVKDLIQQLVGLQVFSGYLNWDADVLAAADVGVLRELKTCQTCGHEINLIGVRAVVCEDCGTEYFLP